MDPLTQALLGAAVAEGVAGRDLGRRAMGWGALAGMAPDLDVLLGSLHDGFGSWLYHRGTTHSLWFGFVAGPLLGWLLWRWRDPERTTPLRAWVALVVVALVTHPILDAFTPYGTQLFAPFWRGRFAWNGVAVVDPFYTVPLAVGVVIAAWAPMEARRRRAWLMTSLAITTTYLVAGIGLNRWAEGEVRLVLEGEGARIEQVRVYPTAMQPWLRHFVAHADDRIFVGLQSATFPACPAWREIDKPLRSARARAVLATWRGAILEWFASGEIAVYEERTANGTRLFIEDLRYAWASVSGRSMWGVAADFDDDGRLVGEVERFERRDADGRDIEELLEAMVGRLPGLAAGWTSPPDCHTG